MSECVDAPQGISLATFAKIDAPHSVGVRTGWVESPSEVGIQTFSILDAPSAVGVRVWPQEFLVTFVKPVLAADESGVSGGPGDGSGGAAGVIVYGSGSGDGWDEPTLQGNRIPFGGTGSSQPAESCILPEITHVLVGQYGNLTEYLYRAQISGGRNKSITGSFMLLHHANQLVTVPNPLHPALGGMNAHNMTLSRAMLFKLSTAGQSSTFPPLLPGNITVDADGIVTVPFTDPTPLLMKEGQSRRDIIGAAGDLVYAHEEMITIGALAGVQVSCRGWPSYPIRELRMADGNYLSWMDAISSPFRCCRRWEGETLIYEPLRSITGGWPLADRFKIESGSYGLNVDGVSTRWKSNRLQEQPGLLAHEKREGYGQVGRIVIQFSVPAGYAYVKAVVESGEMILGMFYGPDQVFENDNDVGAGFIHAGLPAVRWQGSYKTNQPWPVGKIPKWEIWVYGTPANAPVSRFPFDGSFEAQVIASSIEGAYGSRPQYRSLDSPIIPDESTNLGQLNAIKGEAEISLIASSWTTPWVNPVIREGQSLDVTSLEHGNASWLIDSWSLTMNEPGDWVQQLDCLRGL